MNIYSAEWDDENGATRCFDFTERKVEGGWLVLTYDVPGEWTEMIVSPGQAVNIRILRKPRQ